MEKRGRVAFWLVAAAATLLLFLRIGDVPLLDPDEARFARTSVEMLRSGDYVVPTFEGHPRLVKPPLLHWIQATFFRVLGPTELAARLPATLATLGSLFLLGWIARRRFGEEAAAWAAAIFITMPLVLVLGKAGTLDALLSVHILAALCLDLSTDEDRISGAAIGAVLGLSFLTKGPVGVALPLLIMLAGRTASGRRVMPSLRGVLSATAAWAVVVLPWGVAFLESVGFGTATATIRHEVFERAFGGTAHVEPAWYYAKIVAVGCLPWSGPVVLSAARLVRRRQDKIARTAVYSATGLLTGLLFFSLSKGKLPNYLLPLMPLASLLVTFELGQEMWEPRRRKLGSILLSATMLLLSLFLGFAGPGAKDPASVTAALAGAIVFGAGAVAALAGVVLHRPRITYGSAAIAMTLFLAAALSSLPRILSANSAARLVETTPALASGRPVVVLDRELPSLTFYLDRVPEKDTSEQVEARMALGDDPLFVISDRNFEDMPETLRIRLREVGKAGHLRVLEQVPSTP